MQLSSASAAATSQPRRDLLAPESGSGMTPNDIRYDQYKVIRRNGAVVGFEPAKITIAVTKAFLAVNGGQGAASARVRDEVVKLTDAVVHALMKRKPEGGAIHIEEIQDQVELALMRGGEHEVARAYVLYRERRSQERAQEKSLKRGKPESTTITVIDNGVSRPLDLERMIGLVKESCEGLADVDPERILKATLKDLYNGVAMEEVRKCVVLAARTLIEKDPAYSFVTARLLLDALRHEALGEEATQQDMTTKYAEHFPVFVQHGVKIGLLNEALLQYDLKVLGAALKPERDLKFGYLGLQTLYDRYFLVDQYAMYANAGRRFELPQCFFMRVAMGLALNEVEREARAIEFYNVLSTFDFMSSTPHAVQRRNAPLAIVVLLPHDGVGRPRRHLRGDQGERAPVQVRRRPRQRLDQRPRDGLAHQGHQRQVAGCGAVPQGRQRHRGGRQPGRQAQGRRVHLPRDLAPRHRGIPGAPQEHRRRPPPHARHEHGELDSRSLHEARAGRRRLDAVLAGRHSRPPRQMGPRVREGLYALRVARGQGPDQASQAPAGGPALAEDAVDAVRDRPPVVHVQGRLQRPLAAAAHRHRPQLESLHRDHAQHERHGDRRVQPGLGQSVRAHETEGRRRRHCVGARSHEAAADGAHGDAHARQRHRHQLLRGSQGAATRTSSTARSASASWDSRTACT
jgi:hypothetical protein